MSRANRLEDAAVRALYDNAVRAALLLAFAVLTAAISLTSFWLKGEVERFEFLFLFASAAALFVLLIDGLAYGR